jgi:hypothetical protein
MKIAAAMLLSQHLPRFLRSRLSFLRSIYADDKTGQSQAAMVRQTAQPSRQAVTEIGTAADILDTLQAHRTERQRDNDYTETSET